MIDKTIETFYTKNAHEDYFNNYDNQHGDRIQRSIDIFELNNLEAKVIGDFGCGRGFLFKRLNQNNKFFGYDGADIKEQDKYVKFDFNRVDLCQDFTENVPAFLDISVCWEVVEHVAAPFTLLNNIKKLTKENGEIYISIPDIQVGHPVIYYQLFYPHTNFIDFLECMALPILDFQKIDSVWPVWVFKCRNASWTEKKMHFYKSEDKFRNADLMQVTNI